MKLLLDTCAILWIATDRKLLSPSARTALTADTSELFVSAISAFEIAIKYRKGRLQLNLPPDVWWPRMIRHHRIECIPVTAEIAVASVILPPLHNDPSDRIILATAQELGASIITSDAHFSKYAVAPVIW